MSAGSQSILFRNVMFSTAKPLLASREAVNGMVADKKQKDMEVLDHSIDDLAISSKDGAKLTSETM